MAVFASRLYETSTKQAIFSNERPLTLAHACEKNVTLPQALGDLLSINSLRRQEDRFASMTEYADALSKAESGKRITRRQRKWLRS